MSANINVLLHWLNTFDIPSKVSSTSDLEDGTILLHVLHFLASEYFIFPRDNQKLSKEEKKERFDNIKIGLNKFCTHGVRNPNNLGEMICSSSTLVNGASNGEWTTLLELVLLASIKSKQKNECIQRMMNELDSDDQEQLMGIISTALIKFGLADQEGGPEDMDEDEEEEPAPPRGSAPSSPVQTRARRVTVGDGRDAIPMEREPFGWPNEEDPEEAEKKKRDEFEKEEGLLRRIEKLEQKNAALTSELETAQERNKYYSEQSRRNSAVDEANRANSAEIMAIKRSHAKTITSKDAKIKQLNDQISFRAQATDTLEKHLSEAQDRVSELETELRASETNNKKRLRTLEDELSVANNYRRKAAVFESKETKLLKKLEKLEGQVTQLTQFKDMYHDTLAKNAELEEQLSVLPGQKERIQKLEADLLAYQVGGGRRGGGDDGKFSILTNKVKELEVENANYRRKWEESKKDAEALQEIIDRQAMEEDNEGNLGSLGQLEELGESQASARKIAQLQAQVALAVPKATHEAVADQLSHQKLLNEKLSAELEKRQGQVEASANRVDRGKVEALEEKNEQLKGELTTLKDNYHALQRQAKQLSQDKQSQETDSRGRLKELQAALEDQKNIHSREQRCMLSAVYEMAQNF